MPPTPPTKPAQQPREPNPSQLVQEYIDSLMREGAHELTLKAPQDLARLIDHLDAIVIDFALRGKEIDEESVRWMKRQTSTALKGTAKVRNLGRVSRAQAGAANVLSGVAKIALASMLARVTPNTRVLPPQG